MNVYAAVRGVTAAWVDIPELALIHLARITTSAKQRQVGLYMLIQDPHSAPDPTSTAPPPSRPHLVSSHPILPWSHLFQPLLQPRSAPSPECPTLTSPPPSSSRREALGGRGGADWRGRRWAGGPGGDGGADWGRGCEWVLSTHPFFPAGAPALEYPQSRHPWLH